MNDDDKKIKELLKVVYSASPSSEQLRKMSEERLRIMRELPRGIRSPIITLRLVLILSIWSLLGCCCLFFYNEIIESFLVLYRYFTLQQPVPEGFVLKFLPYYILALLGIVETYNFGKEMV